jgi:hypothetical protein
MIRIRDYIYPDYEFDSFIKIGYGNKKILSSIIRTYIRKKLDDKYYLTLMMITDDHPYDGRKNKDLQKHRQFTEMLKKLMIEAYKFIKFGIVIPNGLYNCRGESINAILDPDQRTERERLFGPDVSIPFSRVLTDEEISKIYNNGKSIMDK